MSTQRVPWTTANVAQIHEQLDAVQKIVATAAVFINRSEVFALSHLLSACSLITETLLPSTKKNDVMLAISCAYNRLSIEMSFEAQEPEQYLNMLELPDWYRAAGLEKNPLDWHEVVALLKALHSKAKQAALPNTTTVEFGPFEVASRLEIMLRGVILVAEAVANETEVQNIGYVVSKISQAGYDLTPQ